MSKPRRQYPPEFRRQLIELARAGRFQESLAQEFEPPAQTIRNWVQQAARDGGQRADGLTMPEREELIRLRCEVRHSKLKREILSRATGATVLAIARGDRAIIAPEAEELLSAGDVLAVAGTEEAVDAARTVLVGSSTSART